MLAGKDWKDFQSCFVSFCYRLKVENLLKLVPSQITLDDWGMVMYDPLVTACGTLIRMGGSYRKHCKVFDGHKFVCLDDLTSEKVIMKSIGNHNRAFKI
jgi:hypothetical protein